MALTSDINLKSNIYFNILQTESDFIRKCFLFVLFFLLFLLFNEQIHLKENYQTVKQSFQQPWRF